MILAACFWAATCAAQAVLLSETAIQITETAELSGIDLYDDGSTFVALTDRGVGITGKIDRQNDQITGITIDRIGPILGADGARVSGRDGDSEGIAIAPDGRIYISFEGNGRVWAYDDLFGQPTPIPDHPDFAGYQPNSGLEALAISPDGAIFTTPERSGAFGVPFPVYRYDGDWDIPFSIPRSDTFLITGADFGPDGKLYVLERDFLGIGFRSRVRRFDMNGQSETVMQSTFGTHSNLEGIAVWADPNDKIRLTLISDNGQTFLPTMIVEYILLD